MPVFADSNIRPNVSGWNFVLICLSSVLIAAAGYIINDYFDLNIDRINKPERLIVQNIIKRRWTIVWHFFLSMAGIAIGFFLDFTTRATFLGFSNLICACLLFIYSISLKKKLLAGNVLISLLTAWVVLVITWCEFISFPRIRGIDIAKLSRYTFLYAGFAFIISIIREVIKDMEDMPGDSKYGCRTMPIVWGVNAAKVYTAVWIIILVALVAIVQVYILQFRWWWTVTYSFLFIIAPLIYTLVQLRKSNTPEAYHRLSNLTKMVMFSGILSMVFFYFYL